MFARSRVGSRWWDDARFLKSAGSADVIVINGEGTCHHGRAPGEHLLRVVDHPVAKEKPVVLINALYQENPAEWSRYLEKFALISARDSWSAAELSEASGRHVSYIPDLSMSEGFFPQADSSKRDLLTIGESVLPRTGHDLITLSHRHPEAIFLPVINTLKEPKPKYPFILRGARTVYTKLHREMFRLRRKNSYFCQDEHEFSEYISRSYLHVSGRFHAICFCVAAKTPFCAISSNAWKIEALIKDLGIAKWRVIKTSEIEDILRMPDQAVFTAEERENIKAALERARTGTAQMFDAIARVARAGARAEVSIRN
ncbi:polysaccharide pyruvyl transferase family protein [Chelativorans sp. Marseille-P2723]|uniref:polysaccharide pyruvyl transferase family protein n=1 Tax=Chelativorans sp. Marseille-P2723 TaxID=2709133 RepID=UPI001FEE42F0|nr:polysaccharide pyruvyl transferase family protein [Chelativorans sp. Marseille-P2723]